MFEIFKKNQYNKKLLETYAERLEDVEITLRALDSRLLDVEHDNKILRDKVLRKLQNKSDENLLAETKSINTSYTIGKPIRR